MAPAEKGGPDRRTNHLAGQKGRPMTRHASFDGGRLHLSSPVRSLRRPRNPQSSQLSWFPWLAFSLDLTSCAGIFCKDAADPETQSQSRRLPPGRRASRSSPENTGHEGSPTAGGVLPLEERP